nr:uba domain-containing protein 3 [Quercus suber]
MSKRQQARNERQLQDLIRTVPGNDRCADCGAKNPGWASWNLGLFLCMRCAALHRKLGTHISKVKSLSMDSWGNDQVDNMKSVGNVVGNQLFNPRNVQAQIPVDIDEVEAALEKYIRQKYEQRAFSGGIAVQTPVATRQNTGSTGTGSWSEEPAALPPKPGKRFGFSLRSTSSSLPRAPKNERFTPPLSPAYTGSDRSAEPTSPTKPKKPGHLFGMRITSVANNFDAKLAHLRDMGFLDNKRNTEVLKSSNGNVDKAVETLVRLGEGSKVVPRSLTPVSVSSPGLSGPSVAKTRQPEPKKSSSDPWEIRDEPPQRAVTQPAPSAIPPRSQSAGPPSNSWNPFLSQAPPMPQIAPEQSLVGNLQSMQLSQAGPATQQHGQQNTQQWPTYQANPPQPASNPWQLPVNQPSVADPMYGQQYQQQAPAQPPTHSANPFLRPSRSQVFASTSQMPQQLYAQFPRHDKNSIMALYGHSQQQNPVFQPLQSLPEDDYQKAAPRRSATMPATSMNPFGAPPPPPPPSAQSSAFNAPRHVSNESVDFVGLGRGGRQSPDAFANLSATYGR